MGDRLRIAAPIREDVMLRQFRLLAVAVFVVTCVTQGWLAAPLAWAQDASPVAQEAGPPEGLVDVTLAAGLAASLPEAPAIMLMSRVTIAPGADIPSSPDDPGLSFMLVESGELTVQTTLPLTLIRGAALAEAMATPGTMPVTEDVAANAEFVLAAGDAAVFPPGAGGSLHNDGAAPVVVLVTQMFPAGA